MALRAPVAGVHAGHAALLFVEDVLFQDLAVEAHVAQRFVIRRIRAPCIWGTGP